MISKRNWMNHINHILQKHIGTRTQLELDQTKEEFQHSGNFVFTLTGYQKEFNPRVLFG